MQNYLYPFGLALVISLGLTPVIKKLAWRYKIVDLPSPRKIHQTPIPLLGGAAVFLSFAVVTIFFWYLGKITNLRVTDWQVFSIICAGAVLMIGGFLDDRYSLRPIQQFLFPLAAVLIVIFSGIKITFVTSPLGGIIHFSSAIGIVMAFIWLLGMTYTTKFLDGLDGLVSSVTAIGAIIIFIVSIYWDIPSSGTQIMALILAGASLGFLPYNWHPAKIFLGEGGSVFCGFMLGVLSIISGSKIATTLLIMGVPILDVLWVISRRLWQGTSPAKADDKHLHFRLLDIGLTHRQAVLFLIFVTTVFGLTSLFLHTKGKIIALGVLVVIVIILFAGLVAIYKLKNKPKKDA